MTWEEYIDTVCACKDRFSEAKTQLDWNLASDVNGNRRDSRRGLSSKRKTTENMSPLLNGTGNVMARRRLGLRTGKVKVLHDFTSVSTGRIFFQKSQAPETLSRVKRKKTGLVCFDGHRNKPIKAFLPLHVTASDWLGNFLLGRCFF